ncbi:MAG: type II toxin-antitoxin system Phd/YefM family antitoxin [Anaerolineae bacterium]
MGHTWPIQEVERRFSEVVDEAIEHGPQIVSRRGVEVVVILSYDEYRRMKNADLPLGEFFRQSPLAGAEDLDLERDRSRPQSDIAL